MPNPPTQGRTEQRASDANADRVEAENEYRKMRADRDRLQRENEQLKTLMRYGSEKCHDALRALYKLVDRHGWISGLTKETRDVVLAKAREALKDA